MPELLEIVPTGPFSLPAAAEFGFGPNAGRPAAFDGAMRLAFPVDGASGYAGAVLRQDRVDEPVTVELRLQGEASPEAALRQVARIVSLDHDGEQFVVAGERDPILGALQRDHHGQRPVLFQSPYEGAAWSIISARRPAGQGAAVRRGLAEGLGASFDLAGRTVHAFPSPERLHEAALPGLSTEKAARLRAIAAAALDGRLDVAHLHEIGPERAYVEIQRLKGLGPFYAGLVVLRASGFADAMLELPEPKLLGHAARLYALGSPPSFERFTEHAQAWRPFRTWAIVLIRLAGDRSVSSA